MNTGLNHVAVRHARPPRAFALLAGAAVGFVLGLLAQPALWTSLQPFKQPYSIDDYWHQPMHGPGGPRKRLDVKLMTEPVHAVDVGAPTTAQSTAMQSRAEQIGMQPTVGSPLMDAPAILKLNMATSTDAQSAAVAVPSAASPSRLSTAADKQLPETIPRVQTWVRRKRVSGSTLSNSPTATADTVTVPSDDTMAAQPEFKHAAVKATEPLDPLPYNVTSPCNDNSSLPSPSMLTAMPLRQLYPRFPVPVQAHDSSSFHWVIKSCDRPRLGRLLASTLLSGIFNGLQPASISIVWCKSYQRTQHLPSIIYNLRHSLSLHIWFPSQELDAWPAGATTLTALSVPMLLGAEHLPLLITEDDLAFAPDANMRITAAIQQVESLVQQVPYMLYLYWGEIYGYNQSTGLNDADFQSVPDDTCTGYPQQQSQVLSIIPATLWGTQAQLYSPNMTQMMLGLFEDIHTAVATRNESSPYFYLSQVLEDMVVKWGLEQVFGCNGPNCTCHAFVVQPSLVQVRDQVVP